MTKHDLAVLLSGIVAVFAAPTGQATLITPTSATQNVSASGTVSEAGGPYTDAQAFLSGSTASYSKSATVTIRLPEVWGSFSGAANINSVITGTSISASGSASVDAMSNEWSGDSADGEAISTFEFKFQLTDAANYSIGGSVGTSGQGSTVNWVILQEVGGSVIFSNPSDNGGFSGSGSLLAGVPYILRGFADAMVFDMGGYGMSASANYGFEFSVMAVPEPASFALAAGVGLAGFAVWRRRAAK